MPAPATNARPGNELVSHTRAQRAAARRRAGLLPNDDIGVLLSLL
jgi:hypothetical protein